MSWHAAYRERYARLKHDGKSFFPYTVFKDTLAITVIFAVLAALAWRVGAGLEDLADPTDNTYNPRPEWYFLFLFQALKFFPGSLEAVAAVVMPGVVFGLLALLPFLDRGPERHPLDRPLVTGLGLAALMGVAWLTWRGAHSPLLNPIVEKDPVVMAGQRLYLDLRCAYCHAIRGRGGRVGPDLSKAADIESSEWMAKHFKDPQALTPGSVMPKLDLLDDEVLALVAYVKSLGTGGAFTAEAPRVFADNCAACHVLHGQGGDTGPDLSLIGAARDPAFLRRYITDPSKVNADSTMPGFGGQLTDIQIEDLARFLAHQGR